MGGIESGTCCCWFSLFFFFSVSLSPSSFRLVCCIPTCDGFLFARCLVDPFCFLGARRLGFFFLSNIRLHIRLHLRLLLFPHLPSPPFTNSNLFVHTPSHSTYDWHSSRYIIHHYLLTCALLTLPQPHPPVSFHIILLLIRSPAVPISLSFILLPTINHHALPRINSSCIPLNSPIAHRMLQMYNHMHTVITRLVIFVCTHTRLKFPQSIMHHGHCSY